MPKRARFVLPPSDGARPASRVGSKPNKLIAVRPMKLAKAAAVFVAAPIKEK